MRPVRNSGGMGGSAITEGQYPLVNLPHLFSSKVSQIQGYTVCAEVWLLHLFERILSLNWSLESKSATQRLALRGLAERVPLEVRVNVQPQQTVEVIRTVKSAALLVCVSS